MSREINFSASVLIPICRALSKVFHWWWIKLFDSDKDRKRCIWNHTTFSKPYPLTWNSYTCINPLLLHLPVSRCLSPMYSTLSNHSWFQLAGNASPLQLLSLSYTPYYTLHSAVLSSALLFPLWVSFWHCMQGYDVIFLLGTLRSICLTTNLFFSCYWLFKV